jgi:succinate dehydrogenase / fumarate reductase, membrane anchor subunit
MMSDGNSSLRTPLGRVRGHGAAKSGTGHFIEQRVSAIALAVLSVWFVVAAAVSLPLGYDGARAWVAQPAVALGLILFALAAFFHMRIGLSVVIEDYITKPATKATLLILNTFVCFALAIASAFSIVLISVGS